MKKALILVNSYSQLETSLNQAKRLKEELEILGVDPVISSGSELNLCVSTDGTVEGLSRKYNFCIYLDKDKYTARMLELSGLRLFNSSRAVEVCDDKMLTYLSLSGTGIPVVKTMGGLLCYTPDACVSAEYIDKIEKRLGYPVVVKESYGSLGKGVYKAENRAELEALCEKVKTIPHLYQKFIAESAGRDIRVIVIGGECVAAMLRTSSGDFRSNLELGGAGFTYVLDAKLRDICVRTAKALSLDYCGIDVLTSKNGYKVCEVNSNAFFGGIERVTGVNIAKIYAEYICNKIYK